MASQSEEEIREALEGILKLYDIKLEEPPEHLIHGERHNDYSEIIGKTQARLDDLNEKAEEIFARTGMTRQQLAAYAANPNNFSADQWEALQKVKDACEKYKREARARLPDTSVEQPLSNQPRQKQPQRFAKKKNWIPL